MSEYAISEKLLDILETLSSENNEYTELFEIAKELNILYYNKLYKSYIEKIRVATEYITSIYKVDKYHPEKIVNTKLWDRINNLYSKLYTVERLPDFFEKNETYVEEAIKKIEEVLPISDSLLHREHDKKQFLIDEYIIPSKISINILLQVGMFGIEQTIKDDNLKKQKYKVINFETIFELPTQEDITIEYKKNKKYTNRFFSEIDLIWEYVYYILDYKSNSFLDRYDGIVIAKHLWNGNYEEARKLINTKIEKIKKKPNNIKYYQAQLIKILLHLEDNDFSKVKKISEKILQDSEIEYFKNMAGSYIFYFGDVNYFNNGYKNRKEPEIIENMPKFYPKTSDDILKDFINMYTGSVLLSSSDHRSRIFYNNIKDWIKTYIDYISIGAFEKLYNHFLDLLKIEIIQLGIYNTQSDITLKIFFNLLLRNYHPTIELEKLFPLIENIDFNLKEYVTYINKIIDLKYINSLQANVLKKLIYTLERNQKERLLNKIKNMLDNLDNIYIKEIRRQIFCKYPESYNIELYCELIMDKELCITWSSEKKYLFEIINKYSDKLEYRLNIENRLSCIFKCYEVDLIDEDFEYIEKFLLKYYRVKFKDETTEIINNKVYKELLDIHIYLNREFPNKYRNNINKMDYIYTNNSVISEKLNIYELESIYLDLKNKIESKSIKYNEHSISYTIYHFLIKTKSTEYYNKAIELWNNFIEILFNSNITGNIDNLMNILNYMISSFVKDNINIFEITRKDIIEKYLLPCNWEEIIKYENISFSSNPYTDRAYTSLIAIIDLCSVIIKSKYRSKKLSINCINKILSIPWHQATVDKSYFLLSYLYLYLNEKEIEILKITHINWIAKSPLNIGIYLTRVYKTIFKDDIQSINLISELYPNMHKKILYILLNDYF